MTEKVSKIEKKFQKKPPIAQSGGNTTLRLLRAACSGLIYMSETDSPIQAVAAATIDADLLTWLRKDSGSPPDTRVEEISLDRFFGRLTRIEDWFGERETARAEAFKRLQNLLTAHLNDLCAYRLGEIDVRYYVVGRDATGRLLGIKTAAVET